MDLSYVKKLIKLLADSDVDEIEIEEEGKKIRLVKHVQAPATLMQSTPALQMPVYASPAQLAAAPAPVYAAPADAPPATQTSQKKLHEIKSPIVGTFYKAPAPDAAPFVEIGSTIQPGTVLCIVEAMKLMNEIESDVSGKIVQVMPQNGQAVEYGQVLFLVELA
jgi:acetyl-CoA carboxylase biotin carboxyl carrier protein